MLYSYDILLEVIGFFDRLSDIYNTLYVHDKFVEIINKNVNETTIILCNNINITQYIDLYDIEIKHIYTYGIGFNVEKINRERNILIKICNVDCVIYPNIIKISEYMDFIEPFAQNFQKNNLICINNIKILASKNQYDRMLFADFQNLVNKSIYYFYNISKYRKIVQAIKPLVELKISEYVYDKNTTNISVNKYNLAINCTIHQNTHGENL